MKLLLDNNLSPRMAKSLAALFDGEHEIIHIREKFGTGSLPDAEWIERLGKEGGWCVLSADRRIATKKPSRELFLRARLVGFFLAPSLQEAPIPKLVARILVLWPQIEIQAGIVTAGCFEVTITGAKLRQLS